MTAKHVIEDFAQKHGSTDGSISNIGASLWLIHIYPGPTYAVWEVDQVWTSALTDIAFLHTTPHNDIASTHEAKQLILDMALPQIGDRISGFGYRDSKGHFSRNPDGTRHLDLIDTPTATVGEVVEIFREKRDSFRLPFPCFQVNARFAGGMSGGPLLNDRGQMCGVICSNLAPENDDGEHISYGVILWPAIATLIDFPVPSLNKKGALYPVFDLIRAGIVAAVNHELIQEVQIQGSPNLGIQYLG